MRLEQYIHDLLLEHDCVSIPGFGGLVAQHFRAEVNHGTNLFRPPSKRISYHKELVANSHLLLNKLSREEVVRFCVTLVVAGAETTAYLIGNLIDVLVDQPEMFEKLRSDRGQPSTHPLEACAEPTQNR